MKHRLARTLARASCLAIACSLAQGVLPAAWADETTRSASERNQGWPATVRVESKGVECPSADQVDMALRHVGVLGENATTGWVLYYGTSPMVAATHQAPFVWMYLASPTGQAVARRRLPNDGSDCAAIAGAIAVVVERSLHDLDWTRGEPLPENVRTKKEEPWPARPPRLILGMGPAAGTSALVGLNLLLEARLQVSGPLSLRLGGAVLAGHDSQAVGTGKASVTSRQVSATVLSTLSRSRAHLDAGLVFLVSIDRGKTEVLPDSADGRREALATGLLLGAGVRLSTHWRLAVDIEALRTVAGADFVVELAGSRRVVLPPPLWQGIVCGKLEFVAWP